MVRVACCGRFCDKKFKDYSGRSQHEKRIHNRGPLARGRRKGYRMDRDQLYPTPHQLLGQSRHLTSRWQRACVCVQSIYVDSYTDFHQ